MRDVPVRASSSTAWPPTATTSASVRSTRPEGLPRATCCPPPAWRATATTWPSTARHSSRRRRVRGSRGSSPSARRAATPAVARATGSRSSASCARSSSIGGYTEPQGSRGHFGALHIGLYEGPASAPSSYVCKVGTGFDDKTLEDPVRAPRAAGARRHAVRRWAARQAAATTGSSPRWCARCASRNGRTTAASGIPRSSGSGRTSARDECRKETPARAETASARLRRRPWAAAGAAPSG